MYNWLYFILFESMELYQCITANILLCFNLAESFGSLLKNYTPTSSVTSPSLDAVLQDLPGSSDMSSPVRHRIYEVEVNISMTMHSLFVHVFRNLNGISSYSFDKGIVGSPWPREIQHLIRRLWNICQSLLIQNHSINKSINTVITCTYM